MEVQLRKIVSSEQELQDYRWCGRKMYNAILMVIVHFAYHSGQEVHIPKYAESILCLPIAFKKFTILLPCIIHLFIYLFICLLCLFVYVVVVVFS